MRKLCRIIRPDWGVVTGVNEAHLEKFKTLDCTARTIFELGEFLNGKQLYVNGESERAKKYATSDNVLYDRAGVQQLAHPSKQKQASTARRSLL